MDLAYDRIQGEALSPDEEEHRNRNSNNTAEPSTINADFQEAYKAISASPWGAKLGGFFGSVVKQVSREELRMSDVIADAPPGWNGLQRSSTGTERR